MTDETIAAALERLRRDSYTPDFGGHEARQADVDRIELALDGAAAPQPPAEARSEQPDPIRDIEAALEGREGWYDLSAHVQRKGDTLLIRGLSVTPPAEAMEAWHSAMNDVGELRANAPDERYASRAARVESWIKANRPEPPSAPVGAAEDMVLDAIERRAPSAPVGVDELVRKVCERLDKVADYAHTIDDETVVVALSNLPAVLDRALSEALSQQPAADSRICRVCDGGPGNDGSCLCGHRKWEQPAAVDEAAVRWAVERWNDEVANRPLVNVHRRTLDITWRQVIRHFGGDDVTLCGPRHDDLAAQ